MPITTKLQGGTGNQMFQYAMGLAQARRLNTELQIDISSFDNDPMREYTLSLFPRISESVVKNSLTTVGESGMPYNQSLVDSIKDGDVLNGYWQTEKYFEDIEYDIRWKFQPSPLSVKQRGSLHRILDSKNSTFLVIRRTDYIGNSFHGELTTEYYNDALSTVERLTQAKPTVFVFSDDPEWCSTNLKLSFPLTVLGTYDRTVKGHIGREDSELFLMATCKNAVIANSSFAWWGAYLGNSGISGITIAPKQWFGPASKENPKDIVPGRWIKI